MGMSINLTPQLEEMVKEKVVSGSYSSPGEVISEALHLMEEPDELRFVRLNRLLRDIQEGLDSGPPVAWDPDSVKRDGRASRARGSERGQR